MVGIIIYLISCFAVAVVLMIIYVMLRPVKTRDELKSWRVLLVTYAFSLSAPYAYAEVMTRLVGAHMQHAINAALIDADLDSSSLEYYRVVAYNGRTARVVAVAHGKADWGGTDKPVLALTLSKQGDGWKTDSYLIISSDHLNKDGFTFPPYY
jgi:hypothetical protein